MNIQNAVFRRKFAKSMYKNLKLSLCEMTFTKDFVSDIRGDLYPVQDKSPDCIERVAQNSYLLEQGSIQRYMGQFFPYATYEVSFETEAGEVGLALKQQNKKKREPMWYTNSVDRIDSLFFCKRYFSALFLNDCIFDNGKNYYNQSRPCVSLG